VRIVEISSAPMPPCSPAERSKGNRMGKYFAMSLLILIGGAALAGEAWRAPDSAKSVKNPVAREVGLRLGKALYEENCVICHGASGKGDGEAAAGLKPKPRNLGDRLVQAQTDGELFWKLTEGRGNMPEWRNLPEKERWSLVHYLRSFAGKR